MHLSLRVKSDQLARTGITKSIQIPTFLLKTEKAWPQALHTTLGLPELVGGYVEYPALGANLKGPAPAPNPGCWPLTAPVPMTSFSRPQHEAHMDEAPAWQSQNTFISVLNFLLIWWMLQIVTAYQTWIGASLNSIMYEHGIEATYYRREITKHNKT